LMAGLEDLGLMDNTVIVFTSDHGDMAGEHWFWGKGPYLFDGALRIPGIIAAPGRLPAGRVTSALVEEIDFMPTLLEMAGVDAPATAQGRSCLPLLRGESDEHREDVFSEYHDHNLSGDRMFSLRTRRHRITRYQDRPYGELFDLEEDPDALQNLWDRADCSQLKRDMSERLMNRIMANIARPDIREALW